MEGTSLVIGENSLFSKDAIMPTGDWHSIFSVKDGRRINYSKDISIGNNCWIGNKVTINKGVTITEGTIVGACSVVTKSFLLQDLLLLGILQTLFIMMFAGISVEDERNRVDDMRIIINNIHLK